MNLMVSKNGVKKEKHCKHNWRRPISFLLACSLLFSMTALPDGKKLIEAMSASVSAAENDAAFTYSVYTATGSVKKAEITGYTGTAGDLVIPKTLTDDDTEIPVGRISAGAFLANETLTGLTIAEGTEVEIGEKAFYGCPNLRTVSLPSTVTWKILNASKEMYYGNNFQNCTALTDLTLGDGITVLPSYAFEGCSALTSVRLPSQLKTFENGVFQNCTSLETLEIPEGVQEIGRNAFEGCKSLTKVSFPSTIQRWCLGEHIASLNIGLYDNCAFQGCTSLTEVTFAEGTTVMPQQAFNGTPIKSVTVPSTATALNYTFCDCADLEEVILQDGALTEIGPKAFYGCKSLKNLFLPSTVTSIGEAAFAGCSSLGTLIVPPNTTTFTGNVYLDNNANLKAVYVLADDLDSSAATAAHFTANKIYCLAGTATYDKYLDIAKRNNWSTSRVVAITPEEFTPDLLGVTVGDAYEGTYDAKAHPLVTVTGAAESDTISYRVNGSNDVLTDVPEKTEPGTYNVEVIVTRVGVNYTKTVQAVIAKKAAKIRISDKTVTAGTNWSITPTEYDGDSKEITYTYYKDSALRNKCSGKPTAAGVYYVVATAKEGAHYLSAQSNVAKLQILASTQKVSVKKVSIKKVKSPSKKTMNVQWKKVSKATGYIIWIAKNKKFTKGKKVYTVKSGKTTKKIIRKLTRKKKYFVKVRAYQVVNGTKHKGAFSSVKSVKIK